MPAMRIPLALLIVFLAVGFSAAATDVLPDVSGCTTEPDFALLDFWVGTWDVFVQDKKVGEDRIEKILDGCAVTEDWTSASGGHGHSLFYYQPARKTWKQVWVTERALARGGLKEKELVARLPGGALRFQGEVFLPEVKNYLDRTTLTPVGPDEVRQVIETSNDGGKVWQTTFDARYVRRKP